MKANTIGNFILFILSASCLVLTAVILTDAFSGQNSLNSTASLPGATPAHGNAANELQNRLAAIESRLEAISSSLASGGERESGSSTTLPVELKEFLEKAKMPGSFSNWDETKTQIQRQALVTVVNSLDGPRRDSLREEIAKANWVLEVLETRARKPPYSEAELISRLITYKTLDQSPQEDVSEELTASVTQGLENTIDALKKEIDATTGALKEGNVVADERLRSVVLTADMLDESDISEVDDTRRVATVFLSIGKWRESAHEFAKANVAIDSLDGLSARRVANLIREGELLREQIDELGYAVPVKLNATLDQLTKDLKTSIEVHARKQSAKYQEWALGNIKTAQDMHGAKASEAISNALNWSKRDPGKASKSESIQSILTYYPNFRRKLGELTGIAAYKQEGALTVDSKLLSQTAEKLNQLTGWKGLDELAQHLTRDMVEVRLMVIDESLLERPVANLYNETFDSCWKYLEGTHHRVALAIASATVVKIQPEDLSVR